MDSGKHPNTLQKLHGVSAREHTKFLLVCIVMAAAAATATTVIAIVEWVNGGRGGALATKQKKNVLGATINFRSHGF